MFGCPTIPIILKDESPKLTTKETIRQKQIISEQTTIHENWLKVEKFKLMFQNVEIWPKAVLPEHRQTMLKKN